MAEYKVSINLLHNKKDNILNQFLNWSLSIGRLLIILTQTAALSTFLYRFSLDMQIVDLRDKIKQKSLIVKQFAMQEETFRNLQDKLMLAKQYDKESIKTATIFSDVANMGKGKVMFVSLLVATDNIKVEAQATSAKALTVFVNELKKYPEVQLVSINNIKNSPTNATVNIDLTATLKGVKTTPGTGVQNPAIQNQNNSL